MNAKVTIGRPRFVTLEDALGWHASALAQYGGADCEHETA